MTTLVFPSCAEESVRFYTQASARGEKVVAASSLAYDETASSYAHYFRLPDIYKESFLGELQRAISAHNIQKIYCPHLAVFKHIEDCIAQGSLTVSLLGANPLKEREETYRRLLTKAHRTRQEAATISDGNSTMSAIDIASILRYYSEVFGQSNESKLVALIAIFADAPKGDVIEIGSLWGKSAAALCLLAKHHHTGKLLMVDPWERDRAQQPTSQAYKQEMLPEFDWDLSFEACCINLLPVGKDIANYLRLPSVDANRYYAKNKKVTSAEFGEVRYEGRVSVLHIDGNHEYDAVKKDYKAWRPFVKDGGWVIIDDYFWLEGDGPKRLGNEVLIAEEDDIHTSFVCGKALFIKLCNR